MIRIFTLLIFLSLSIFADTPSVEKFNWPNGMNFLSFLEKSNIPLSLYYDLNSEDQELASEIVSGSECFLLKDEKSAISQILIPINEEMQIQIHKDKFGRYKMEFIPIIYTTDSYALGIEITSSPYANIMEATGNSRLANEFLSVFRNEVDFRKLQKGDRLVILYEQKTRLGAAFGAPTIIAAMIEENKTPKYQYRFEDKFYDEKGKKSENFLLITPVNGAKITSKFTLKRYHPLLKRYRAHLGVDYAAPKGTKIISAGGGKVSFVGRKGGYGNTVEINHGNGYTTLYAHLNGFAKGIQKGMSVKQGQLIGYIGNTGLSSGPHLHFGLYRGTTPIDPLKVVKVAKTTIISEEEKAFKKLVKELNIKINEAMNGSKNPEKYVNFDYVMPL